jgi:hypothetical protein
MEHKGSLPCSQESSTGPYPKPDESSPYHPIPISLISIFSLLSLFWKKIKVGLCDFHAVCVSHPINFWISEPVLTKLGMYIMAPEPISTAYFINPSHQSVCLYLYPSYHC